ncbi:MAG: alpha-(1-_3)-arabinofuranosyltransferase family protein [Patulibacter minatonensis]
MSAPAERPRRRWLLLAAAVLVALAFAQVPGRLAFDTKLDLTVDPVGFLARSLHLWDATGGLGQVQNQAVGYAFPMGPFFALGDLSGLPMWAVQRLWLALLLCTAMWGMARLAAALGVGREPGWIIGGLAYALAPFFTGLIGFTSAAVLPAALLPWTIVPLVAGARGGSPRQAAARSGVAILLMGGVNATSALAVLTLPGLYLLTRTPGRRARALLGWWCVAAGLACFWWFAALVFQAKYGLSVVEYTETPQVTESTTAAAAVLRGTGNWLGYLNLGAPWVPASWTLGTAGAAVLATTLTAAAGLAGLVAGRFAERRFVGAAFALAACAICAGYTGNAGGLFSPTVLDLLDGPLAAFRNVYKFEPVLAAATALGLAHVVSAPWPVWRWPARVALAAATCGVLAVGALPLVKGEATTPGAFDRVPTWWTQAADWLGTHAGRSTTLLLPGSAFAENTWGRPLDEPMQALAQGPWVTRTLQPLGGIGSTRVLDDLERRIVQRRPSPGLRATLRRAGVRYVVARNDLNWRNTSAPRPILVRDALRGAGLERVAAFGPRVPVLQARGNLLPDLGIGEEEGKLRMLEIYAVDRAASPVTTAAVATTTVVSGGPESIAQVAGAQQASPVTVLAADLPAGGDERVGPWVVSDALRRVRTDFGLVRDNTSYTLAAGELAAGSTSTPQFLAPNLVGHETVALPPNVGGAVTASSYGSWLLQLPELQPANAFDRNADTVWVAGNESTSVGEWIEATLPAARPISGMQVRLLREGEFRPRITRLKVVTDVGSRTTAMRDTEALQPVAVPPGATRRVRIVLDAVVGERRGAIGAGLRDVYLPSNVGLRRFVAPAEEASLLGRARAQRTNPTFLFTRLTADPFDLLRRDEEPQLRRQFTVPVAGRFTVDGTATPQPGAALDRLLTRTRGLAVTTSSAYGGQPRYKGENAFDGTANTSWIAAPPVAQSLRTPSAPGLAAVNQGKDESHASPVPSVVDDHPSLGLSFRGVRTLDRVRVERARGFAVAPKVLRITGFDGRRTSVREVHLRPGRMVRFPAMRVRALAIDFPQVEQRFTNGPGGRRIPLPVGVAEIDFPALRSQRIIPLPPTLPVATACGDGPLLLVDDRPVRTRLATTAGAAVSLEPARVQVCDAEQLRLGEGTHAIRSSSGGAFGLSSLRLRAATRTARAVVARSAQITRWETTDRTIAVGAGDDTYLAIRQNFNAGWSATLDGRPLRAQQLDGWQQGFVVPAGRAGVVELRYAPDAGFRKALLVGAAFALLLLAMTVFPPRGMGAAEPAAAPAALPGGRWRWPFVGAAALLTVAVSVPVVVAFPALLLLAGRPRGTRVLAALAAASLVGAGIVTAIADRPFAGDHGGAFSTPAQLLATLALAALLAALVTREPEEPR